jgi:murein DD-endopeptidase MepM/ murein hydrolase activator NlpD
MISNTQKKQLEGLRKRWQLNSGISQRNRVAYVLRRSKDNYIRVVGNERGLMQYQAECLEYVEGIGNHHEVARFERSRVVEIINKAFVSFPDDHIVTKLVEDFKDEIYGIFRRKPKEVLDVVETDPAPVTEIVLSKEQVPGPSKLSRGMGLFQHWSKEAANRSKKYAVLAAASTVLLASSPAHAGSAFCGPEVMFLGSSKQETQSITAIDIQFYTDLEPGSGYYFPEMIYPVGNAEISSYFGYRNAPCAACSTNHQGVDFAPGYGTKVSAAIAGTVTLVGYDGELGYTVIISDGKHIETVYGHMIPGSATVSVGDVVKLGQKIGKVGDSGVSTGPHLHFGLKWDGRFIDPLRVLKQFAGR